MPVVVRERCLRIDAARRRPRKRVRRDDRAGDLLRAIDAVRVAGEREDIGKPVEFDREGEQEFDVPAAPPRSLDGDGGLAPRQQDHGRRGRLAAQGGLPCDPGHDAPDLARLALQRIAENERRDARLARDLRRRFEGQLRSRDRDGPRMDQTRVAGLRRLVGGAREMVDDRSRFGDPVFLQHRDGIGEGRGVGHRRSRRDHGGIIAGHVRDDERHELRGVNGGRELSALDRGQVLSNNVHFADRRARSQQGGVHGLFVRKRQAGRGKREQRGAAARDQRDHEIVGAEPLDQRAYAPGRRNAARIGNGMGGLDDLDALARVAVAVARHDQSGEGSGPVFIDGPRHRR